MHPRPLTQHHVTVAIFAKPPTPGEVKTRLIPVLGSSGAAQLAMAFLVDAIAGVRRCSWARLVVATTGSAFTDDHRLEGVPIWQQGGGDLGERLERIMVRGLSAGDRAVIALGADSPGLSVGALEKARDVLDTHEAVLGPAHDGGYYLVGLRRCPRGVFEGIRWSVPETFEETRARLIARGLSLSVSEPYFDVDTPDDLDRLEAQLRNGAIRAPATAGVLKALGRI